MLRFKPEVRIGYFTAQLAELFTLATVWSMRRRVDVEINAIDETPELHSATTLHGFGLAVDFDTAGDKETDLVTLEEWFRRMLHPQYDVVFEGDHVHVEWDARRGPARRKP